MGKLFVGVLTILCVVMTAGGYPGSYAKGIPIEGLDAALEGAFESPDISGDHREAVYGRTVPMIRGYRRWRLLRSAAALLTVFLAGAGSGALLFGSGAAAPAGPRTVETVSPALPSDLRDLDRKLRTAPPEERRRILRHAGDSYLEAAEADPGAALHCYRQLLEEEVYVIIMLHQLCRIVSFCLTTAGTEVRFLIWTHRPC